MSKEWTKIIVTSIILVVFMVLALPGCLKSTSPPKTVVTTPIVTTAYVTLSQFNDLSSRVQILEAANAAKATTIGATPTTINGLAVTILIGSAYLAAAPGSTASQAQLAVKIVNTNTYSLSNLDIFGTISLLPYPTQFGLGYPQLQDEALVVNYVAINYNAKGAVTFEAGSTPNKTPITLAAGQSLTLRPVLQVAFSPAATATLSITEITYDKEK